MRKMIMLFLASFFVFNFTTQTYAVGVIYKNKPITMDVAPQIIDGRTLVPIRSINDALNGETSWDHNTKQVTLKKGEMNIVLKIGDRIARVDGKEVELDVPAQIISNRTFVPLRFVSEHFGHNVEWDNATKTVFIDSNKTTNDFTSSDISDIDFTKIYEVNGTGKYAGYKKLVGYPYDDRYTIYYSGGLGSYQATYEDLNPKNLQEKITWEYRGKSYTHTRSQLYEFFSDVITLESLLGESNGIANQDWLFQTFGDTYDEWFLQRLYSQEAVRIVNAYLFKKSNINLMDRYSMEIDLDSSDATYDNEDSVNSSIWVSEKELSIITDGILLSRHVKVVGNTTELEMAFIKTSSLTGMTSNVVYELPDMPLDYIDSDKEEEDIFNGVRIKKVNGNVYFNRTDLIEKKIIKY